MQRRESERGPPSAAVDHGPGGHTGWTGGLVVLVVLVEEEAEVAWSPRSTMGVE